MISFDRTLYFLAPLAGYTDLPFRSVVKRFGADVTVSEMISANALAFQNAKTLKMLEKSPLETPYSIQISGNDPYYIQKAVAYINTLDGVDDINLNCGCPAPKVANNGAGSGLLRDLSLMGTIIETMKKHAATPTISVKTRIGFNEKRPEAIARVIEESGADFTAVHGRTKSGGYKSRVDYDAIARIVDTLSIPVVANGDITTPAKAAEVLKHTKAKGIMVGRGAVGNPWIFEQMKAGQAHAEPLRKKQIILEHFDQMVYFYGQRGVPMFRKHLHTYSKGYPQAGKFRDKINNTSDPAIVREMIQAFF